MHYNKSQIYFTAVLTVFPHFLTVSLGILSPLVVIVAVILAFLWERPNIGEPSLITDIVFSLFDCWVYKHTRQANLREQKPLSEGFLL